MTILQFLPIAAYALALLAIGAAIAAQGRPHVHLWLVVAGGGAAFVAFSVVTILEEGPLQFWVNHTTTLAGNQVWFDLLFATCIGFFLLAPRARAVGMRLWPWGLATALTACIALVPMLARVLYLEARTAPR